jgi:hypothetical protein
VIARTLLSPPVTHARWGSVPVLVVLLILMVVAVAWALSIAIRERDLMPVLICAGGVIAVINEPLWDALGRIVYASNQPILYTSFGGRQVPVYLLSGYVVWVGVLGIAYSRLMAGGVKPAMLYKLATGSFLSVVLVEVVGNSSHLWTYYGQAPAKFLVVAPQMAPVPLVCGFLIHVLRGRVGKVGQLAYIAVPGCALAGVFAMTSWPIYYILNADVPVVVNWMASVFMLALCAGVVWLVGGSFGEPAAGSGGLPRETPVIAGLSRGKPLRQPVSRP